PSRGGDGGGVAARRLGDARTAWPSRRRARETTAGLPPGGGLVLGGWGDRGSRPSADATEKVLWKTRLNNVISAFPISYSVNGKQYVAVAVGGGSTMPRALATLTPEIQNPDGGSGLWVFALPN